MSGLSSLRYPSRNQCFHVNGLVFQIKTSTEWDLLRVPSSRRLLLIQNSRMPGGRSNNHNRHRKCRDETAEVEEPISPAGYSCVGMKPQNNIAYRQQNPNFRGSEFR